MKYIRDYYHVPAKRGGKVRRKDGRWTEGTIMSAHGSHLKVRFQTVNQDGEKRTYHVGYFHPLDLEYLEAAQ